MKKKNTKSDKINQVQTAGDYKLLAGTWFKFTFISLIIFLISLGSEATVWAWIFGIITLLCGYKGFNLYFKYLGRGK